MPFRLLVAAQDESAEARVRELLRGADVGIERAACSGAAASPRQSLLAQAIETAASCSRDAAPAVLAFASGLTIPALGHSWPDLIAPPNAARDVPAEEKARRLLRRMRDLEGEQRACRWTEAVAVATSGRLIGAWEASSPPGRIAGEYAPPSGACSHWTDGLWTRPANAAGQADPLDALAALLRDLVGRLGEPDAPPLSHD